MGSFKGMVAAEEVLKGMLGRITPSSTPRSYACEVCQDTGWEHYTKDGYSFSKVCACRKAKQAEDRINRSGLKYSMQTMTFDSFRTATQMQKNLAAMARRYLDAVQAEGRKPWMYVGGNPGSGKTHICTAVCGELLRANHEVVYMQWLDEARTLKAYVNEPDFDNLVSRYIDCEILYIDDLLKQTYREIPVISDADIRMAFSVLNGRYVRNKPTIITSEWDLVRQLIPADEGLFSRVFERCKGFIMDVERNPANNYRMAL